MSLSKRTRAWLLRTAAAGSVLFIGPNTLQAQAEASGTAAPQSVTVNANVALNALVSLADAHLQKMSDVLSLVAATDAARSADWQLIRDPYASAARINVPAVHWFALPDGSYWTLEEGRATGNLHDRPYFGRLLAGHSVTGELVVSRSTGRSSAIVAVPVRGPDGVTVGVLGTSVYLDSLSMMIHRALGLGKEHLFYSLDSEPVVGLHADPEVIFLHPLEEGDAALSRAIREIVSNEAGSLTYDFRGRQRSVVYRKSPVTGWSYVFGIVQPSVITSK